MIAALSRRGWVLLLRLLALQKGPYLGGAAPSLPYLELLDRRASSAVTSIGPSRWTVSLPLGTDISFSHIRAGHRILLPSETAARSRINPHGGTDEADRELGRKAWKVIANVCSLTNE